MVTAPLEPISSADQRAHHELAARLAGLDIPELVAPTHSHHVVGGLRLHLLDWGRPEKPPVLFLHGGGQTARTWDLICLALRPEYRCLALDQRGHGDSEWSYDFDYAPESHARDVAGVLDALGIERIVVVGMSMGCLNGLAFAVTHPERVGAFVAVDAGPWVHVEGGRGIIRFMTDSDGARSIEELVEKVLRFNRRRDPRLLAVSLRHNLRRLPDGTLTWKTDRRRAWDLEMLRARLERLQAQVGGLTCPTLILRGAESGLFLDRQAARFAAALPDARWVRVEGAGHTIQGDAPAALVREVRAFLDRIGTRPWH